MRPRLAAFVAGLLLSSTVAATAAAANGIDIKRALVPGGKGNTITVSLTYTCDATAAAKAVVVEIGDPATFASGAGRVPPTCDSASHPVDVTVRSRNSLPFRRADDVTVDARLTGTNGKAIDGAHASRAIRAE